MVKMTKDKANVTQEDREKFCKLAYEYGYSYFQNSYANYETQEDIAVMCDESFGRYSQSEIIRKVESHYGFEKGKHDWSNFGIYGIIEDIVVCYESGCRHALDSKECNPEKISHMWDY